ncbi:PspC domain-containing protein [Streptomyces luteolus]|uniref:PspC domain-containing protein n=1 Tax=Streptomyces luteolus TaxID=3043615 RepID=A0ABT6SVW4_9ACTN|nr:PspC domain-containing protein [Streptomyces sp. B-S-A12]MDI3419743.1 PspC domain-containing protein [Streptomyces sp. B-S-A12]
MNDQDLAGASAAEPSAPPGLRRERSHRMLGGVCSGLGRHCDMDPVIFRIGLAVLAVTGGLGLIFYGFAWLLLPLDGDEESEGRKLLTGRVSGAGLSALLCALIGCGVFLSMLNNGGVLTFAAVLTLLLAGAGYWSQARRDTHTAPVTAQAVADAPPEAQAPPVAGVWSWWRDPIVKDGTHEGGTGYAWGPADHAIEYPVDFIDGTKGPQLAMPPGPYHRTYRPTVPKPVPEPKPRGPRWIGGWVFLLALLAGALGTGLTWSDHGGAGSLGLSLQAGLACALAVFGLGIAVSAFLGRTGGGSIVLAVLTAGLLAVATALPENIGTTWTRTDWRPTGTAQVRPVYEVGSGVGTLDLTGLDLRKGQTVKTAAEVGAGRVEVVVPKDVTVRLRAEVGVGDIRLPGEASDDVDIAPGQDRRTTLRPPEGTPEAGTVDLRLEVGVGQAEVRRETS